MSYISEIFERIDLLQISTFLKCGSERSPDGRSYAEQSHQRVDDLAEAHLPEFEDRDSVLSAVNEYAAECESVYFELGVQAGALLLFQLIAGGFPAKRE